MFKTNSTICYLPNLITKYDVYPTLKWIIQYKHKNRLCKINFTMTRINSCRGECGYNNLLEWSAQGRRKASTMAASMKLHKDLVHRCSCVSYERILVISVDIMPISVPYARKPVSSIPAMFFAGFPHVSHVLYITSYNGALR